MKKQNSTQADLKSTITYRNMFWLFMIGNVLGVILEGIWSKMLLGHWETHVVTIWGPFCLIYGIGAVVLYVGAVMTQKRNVLIQFSVIAVIASVVELLCGLILEFGMGMRAWNYSAMPFNFRGHICLKMSLMWGVIGIVFSHFMVKPLNKMFDKLNGKFWKKFCVVLSVFMAINLTVTLGCMVRWRNRHNSIEPKTYIGQVIDNRYDDTKMQTRFCEWYFI